RRASFRARSTLRSSSSLTVTCSSPTSSRISPSFSARRSARSCRDRRAPPDPFEVSAPREIVSRVIRANRQRLGSARRAAETPFDEAAMIAHVAIGGREEGLVRFARKDDAQMGEVAFGRAARTRDMRRAPTPPVARVLGGGLEASDQTLEVADVLVDLSIELVLPLTQRDDVLAKPRDLLRSQLLDDLGSERLGAHDAGVAQLVQEIRGARAQLEKHDTVGVRPHETFVASGFGASRTEERPPTPADEASSAASSDQDTSRSGQIADRSRPRARDARRGRRGIRRPAYRAPGPRHRG